MTATGPTVYVEVPLGDLTPQIYDDDPDYRPISYTATAHHRTTLSPDGASVTDRVLERITLTYLNEEDEKDPAIVELPIEKAAHLEALTALIDHARDYLTANPIED